MHLRRTVALATGAVVFALPTLAGCGFNYATDRINTVTSVTNYRDGVVNVLNAAIVAKAANSGTFVAGLNNNDPEKSVSLTSIAPVGTGSDVKSGQFSPIEVKPGGFVNLADDNGTNRGVPVTGTFQPGDVVSVTLNFDTDVTVTMDVRVVADDGQWAGLDISSAAPSDSASASSSPSSSPSSTESPSANGS